MKLDNVEDIYPLSSMQEGMLFHSIAEPSSGVFLEQVSCLLEGDLKIPQFRRSWGEVVARHPPLRTLVLWDGIDEPLQVVKRSVELEWQIDDLSSQPAGPRRRHWQAFLQEDRERGFDLSVAPLMRMALVQEGTQRWRWLWTFHHLIFDGWSTHILLQEVFSRYASHIREVDVAVQPAPFTFRDFVAWQKQQDLAAAEQFWRRELAGFGAPTRPQIDFWMERTNPEYRQQSRQLTSAATTALRDFARQERVTLSTVTHAVWAVLLSRYAGADDIVFGTTMSGRRPELPAMETAVGLFINTLPLRLQVDRDLTVVDFLRQLQRRQLEIRQWEHSPLVAVQRWSDIPPGEALFDSIVVFENYPESGWDSQGHGLQIRELEFLEQSNFPLAALFVPSSHVECVLVYDAARYSDETVTRMLGHLAVLLESFPNKSAWPISKLSLLTSEEQRQVDAGCSHPAEEAWPAACIHHLFEACVQQSPDAPAVSCGAKVYTYAQLDERANALAQALRASGIRPDQCVGLMLERSPEMIVGILGILKAGAAYVPLDPTYPARHLEYVIRDAELSVVLTVPAWMKAVPQATARIVNMEELPGTNIHAPVTTSDDAGSENLAYVIYTSGSSGRPKGVMVTHRNLIHSTTARFEYYQQPVTRFLLLSSFAFDSSVAGIFWTLCSGGTLVLPAVDLEQDLHALAELMRRQQVTHVLCLPTLYALMLEHAPLPRLASLETVIVAGEACSPALAAEHLARLPHVSMYNEYGPTETTVWSTVHEVTATDAAQVVPIGRPIARTQAVVLDHCQQPAPVGVPGELYLVGPGVARGYLHRPELTADCFPTLTLGDAAATRCYRTGDRCCQRSDGVLLFLGRADSQVKFRGHRIELGEVEHVIRQHPEIDDVAVVAREDATPVQRSGAATSVSRTAPTRLQLIAYIVPRQPPHADDGPAGRAAVSDFMADLRGMLPRHMQPAALVPLDELPRTPNGKVDVRGLPDPPRSTDDAAARTQPSSDMEQTLANIWSDVLATGPVGIHDNFFELGGDSIVSIQIISRAREAGLQISPQQFVRHPTIAELAARVIHAQVETLTSESSDEPIAGPVALTPIQHWFLEWQSEDPHHWNLSRLFEVPPDFDVDVFAGAWRHCLTRHDMLRAHFEHKGIHWRQLITAVDEFPIPLSTLDVSTLAPAAQEKVWRQKAADLQAGFDLAAGPLIHALVITRAPTDSRLLLVVVHHLIIDAMSWEVLLDDLESAYRQLSASQPISLPSPTATCGRWVDGLREIATSDSVREKASYWTSPAAPCSCELPRDYDGDIVPTEATAARVSITLAPALSRALLSEVHHAYQTQVYDLLMTAVMQSMLRWTGESALLVDLEGHGRAPLDNGLDVSRTVGWFTSMCPVILHLPAPYDPGAALKSIKAQMSDVAGWALSYGALRYLSAEEDPVRCSLGQCPRPQVLLNYLSSVGERDVQTIFRPSLSMDETSRSPRSKMHHLLEINARFERQQLRVDWIFSSLCHRQQTIESLAEDFRQALSALIQHCQAADAGGFTPADFPEAELSQEELDRFLEGIE